MDIIDIVHAITTIIGAYLTSLALSFFQYDLFRSDITSSLSIYLGTSLASLVVFPLHVIVLVIAVKFFNFFMFGYVLTNVPFILKKNKKSLTTEHLHLSMSGIVTTFLIGDLFRIASLFKTAYMLETIVLFAGIPLVFLTVLKLNRRLSIIGPI